MSPTLQLPGLSLVAVWDLPLNWGAGASPLGLPMWLLGPYPLPEYPGAPALAWPSIHWRATPHPSSAWWLPVPSSGGAQGHNLNVASWPPGPCN